MKTKLEIPAKLAAAILMLTLLQPPAASAQGLYDAGIQNRSIGIHMITSTMVNPSAVWEGDRVNGPFLSFGMDIERYDFVKGGGRFILRSKSIGDLTWNVYKQIKKESTITPGATISSLFDLNYGKNLISTPFFAFGAGGHTSDYIVGIRKADQYGYYAPYDQTEPSGWWFTAGPMVYASLNLVAGLSLHSSLNYGLPLFRASTGSTTIKTEGYPKPHIAFFNVHLTHNSGIHAGIDMIQVFDRGTNQDNAARFDLYVGYRFKMMDR